MNGQTYIIALMVIGVIALAVYLISSSDRKIVNRRLRKIKLDETEKKKSEFTIKSSYNEALSKFRARQQVRLDATRATRKNAKLNETEMLLEDVGLAMTSTTFWIFRFLLGSLIAVIIYFLISKVNFLEFSDKFLLALCGLIGGLIFPMFFVKRAKKKKKEKLVNSMADMMELLSVSTTAGLGLDNALTKIYDYNKTPAMNEMMYALSEVQQGVSKRKAYKAMAARCDCREMTNFVSVMLQAEDMGIPISEVLKSQSELLREERKARAEEKAEKAPVKMMLPLVFCMFPAIFIVLLGPAVINIFKMFSTF